MKYILAFDQGTTSSRAIVFDERGGIVALAQREFQQSFPQPGWVEHDPQEIWSTQLAVAQEALQVGQAASRPTSPRSASPTSARRSSSGIARPASRSTPRSSGRIAARRASATSSAPTAASRWSRRKPACCSIPISAARRSPGFSTTSPVRAEAAEAGQLACGTIDSWLVYKLTGGRLHVTDASNASRTLLMNIHTGEWDDELLAMLRRAARDAARDSLVQRSLRRSERRRRTRRHPDRRHRRRSAGGPVRSGLLSSGMAKNTYGTGCFMLMNTADRAVESQQQAAHDDRLEARRRSSNTRSKAACSSAGPSSPGSATDWASSSRRPTLSRWPTRCPTAAASFSCPRSPASVRRIGIRTPAARSSASRAARRPPTSPAPRSTASPFRSPTWPRRCTSDAGTPLVELRVDGGASVNDTLAAISGRCPAAARRAAEGDRNDRARRRLPRRPRGRRVEEPRRSRPPLASRSPLRAADVGRRGREAARSLERSGRTLEELGAKD